MVVNNDSLLTSYNHYYYVVGQVPSKPLFIINSQMLILITLKQNCRTMTSTFQLNKLKKNFTWFHRLNMLHNAHMEGKSSLAIHQSKLHKDAWYYWCHYPLLTFLLRMLLQAYLHPPLHYLKQIHRKSPLQYHHFCLQEEESSRAVADLFLDIQFLLEQF